MKAKLETTRDYNIFRMHNEQRPLIESHIKGLRSSMEQLGFLPSKPLQCVRNGSGLICIDGHHRLMAAKSLGIPVHYVVEEKFAPETMTLVNSKMKAWGTMDYIVSFAKRGLKDYTILRDYIDRGLPASIAINVLYGDSAGSNNATRFLKSGAFKVKTTQQANDLLDFINDTKSACPQVMNTNFLKALSLAWPLDEFDLGTFKARLASNAAMLPRCSNVDDFLTHIEHIYNFRSRSLTPIRVLAKEAARKRAALISPVMRAEMKAAK